MQVAKAGDVASLAGYAGAALLCSMLTQWLSSQGSEIYSEILCWAILPVIITYQKQPQCKSLLGLVGSGESKVPTSPQSSQWMVAGGVAIFSLSKTGTDVIQFLPALTPLLLAYQRYVGPTPRPPAGLFSHFGSTVWIAAPIASFSISTFSDWNIQASLLSIIPTAALLAVYAILSPKSGKFSFLPSLNIEHTIRPLSVRIIILLSCILTVDAITFGLARTGIIFAIILGISKASSWYFIIRMAQSTSWSVASLIGTFSIASASNPLNKSSDIQTAAYVCVAFISLGQLIAQLPKQEKFRCILWVFGLISLIPVLSNLWMIQNAEHLAKVFGPKREHPVEALVRNSKDSFEHLIKRQSKNYEEAVEEYQRRYGVGPPPGFEAWYNFAVHHQSPIIDDFDIIYDAISPIWSLSGHQVLEIMNRVYLAPNSEMWFCIFYGKYAATRCTHPDRIYDRNLEFQFDMFLHGLEGLLPDVRFLFNHFDEPRILIPAWGVEHDRGHQQFNIRNISRQPVWNEITKFCATKEKYGRKQMQEPREKFDLPFVEDHSSAIDLCIHPEYHNLHGLFMSPVSFSLIEGFVPALSTGSPSTMGDILFPSPAYIELEFAYDDAREVNWDQKRNNLYWAGSTTGGFALNDDWPFYHRQRFVKLAQNLGRQQHQYLRETGGIIQRVASSFLDSRLFDVAFTKIFQCERKYCRDQRRYFQIGGWADKDRALRSRLVFDLDGNGISGRYYKLLASKSAPLKQTLLREWHDDRLVPWVHYIPVSQSLHELPELVLYLTSTEAGQRHAREIAEQGRDWFSKALREADMAVYTYRLLLELARLQDPNREAGFPAVR